MNLATTLEHFAPSPQEIRFKTVHETLATKEINS